jgi:hypothetical protein
MATLYNVEPELSLRATLMIRLSQGRFWVQSGWRSKAEQKTLRRLHEADPKRYPYAADPDLSKHCRDPAEAVDIACLYEDNPLRINLAWRCGLHAPIPGEPWHHELAPWRSPLPDEPQEDDMPTPHSCIAPSGRGWWQLNPDGSVEARTFQQGDAIAFHGSLFDYPQERTKINPKTGKPRVWTTIQAVGAKDEDGYYVFADDGFCGKLHRP